MAVYKKTYKRYDGPLTAAWSRFLVIPRYAFEEMNRSRFLTLFFFATFIYPLVCALIIWVEHNVNALALLNLKDKPLLPIDTGFFLSFLGFQSMMGFFLASFIGPGTVSPDLTNNALPLYLARPFSRVEYVLGKMSILVMLLSAMTWIPGLLLFGLQAYLEGGAWAAQHVRIAVGLFFGSWIWILVLALMALALSAWVRWKPAAGALMFGVFFVMSGFGAAFNAVLRTKWGRLIDISHLIGSVWVSMFEGIARHGEGAVFFRVASGAEDIPMWCNWAALFAICLFLLSLLNRKIRGAEVVR